MFLSVTDVYVPKRRCIILGDPDEVNTIASFLKPQPFFDVIPAHEHSDGSGHGEKSPDLL